MTTRARARSRRLALLFSLSAAGAYAQGTAPAEPRVLTPGRSLAATDDASAIAVNPANLAFLPSAELRALGVNTGQDSPLPGRGLSFDLATPLVFDFSAGLRLDLVSPPASAPMPDPYRALSFALAYQQSEALSVGVSLMRTYSDSAAMDGLFGATVATSYRPFSALALSAAARNVTGFENSAGTRLDRAYDAGLALMPAGTRAVTVGLEGEYEEAGKQLSPRASLGVDIPGLGRLRGDVRIDNPLKDSRAYVATAGLEVVAGRFSASGGGVFGSQLGRGGAGFYAGLAARGYREPGVHLGRYFVKIRLESTPGDRAHVKLLRALWKMADDDEVAGVGFVLKTEPASSFPHAEELGDAIRMLRSRGKKVFCHLEDNGGRSLYACSQADRIVMNPAGGLRFSGLRSQYMYFGQVLSNIGVRADFVRIGAHKTAAEQLAASGPTPVAEDDHRELLLEQERSFLSDVGGGRRIAAGELRERLSKGPFVAAEARAAGLIDGYAFDDDLDQVASELYGSHVPFVEAERAPLFQTHAPEVLGERDRLAIVYVDGDMIDGRSREIPLIGTKLSGSYTVAAAVKEAREDPRIRAVVLRLETPGGSSLAADVIWREVALTTKVKPVVVSMGTVAASAGYYIAAPGSVIFANKTTITGSIGVFYGKADIGDLLKRVGVNIVTYRTAPRADAESIYRPFTDDERVELGRKVKQFYDTFVDRVARGRPMLSVEQIDALGRGKVWTGEQAVARHLVDRLGGLREAIAEAERLGGLARRAPIVELPEQPRDLLSTVLSLAGFAAASEPSAPPTSGPAPKTDLPLPASILRLGRALLPFALYAPDQPIARLDMALDLP